MTRLLDIARDVSPVTTVKIGIVMETVSIYQEGTTMAVINGLEVDNLVKVVEAVKQKWEMGKTVWKASTTWKGGFRVETCSRDFTLLVDEPEMLCGTNTAANPVELVLQAYGACLSIGYAMNAAVRGIKIHDLPGFLGLEPPESLKMDKLPGFKTIDVKVKIKADATPEALRQLHAHVVGTSPVGLTLSRPVKIGTDVEVL